MQEWEITPADVIGFEHLVEEYEEKLLAGFPELLDDFGRDILDHYWPGSYAPEEETSAFEAAVSNVITELKRRIEGPTNA